MERNALTFLVVGNGHRLAIDPRDGKVKYLFHDDPAKSGTVLGGDFCDSMSRWTLLGCIGPDIEQVHPFLSENGLDPFSPDGVALREWLFGVHKSFDVSALELWVREDRCAEEKRSNR